MKKLITCFTLLSLIALSGCVQVDTSDVSRAQKVAISSVRDLPITYQAGDTFSLAPKHTEKLSVTKDQIQLAYGVYAKAIISSLEAKGYQYITQGKPDFYVGYGLALGKDLSDQAINNQFGVLPGLPVPEDLEKGSFLIYIEDSVVAKQVWRGALQGFIHEENSMQEREQRAAYIVNAVLKQFYVAK